MVRSVGHPHEKGLVYPEPDFESAGTVVRWVRENGNYGSAVGQIKYLQTKIKEEDELVEKRMQETLGEWDKVSTVVDNGGRCLINREVVLLRYKLG